MKRVITFIALTLTIMANAQNKPVTQTAGRAQLGVTREEISEVLTHAAFYNKSGHLSFLYYKIGAILIKNTLLWHIT
jgi:hypothetical protein